MVKKALVWIPVLLYMALIFYLSSQPAPEQIKAVPIYCDIKIVHVVEYGILSLLFFFGIFKTAKIPLIWICVFSVVLTYIYGLTDELHQVFVPTRSGCPVDTLANFIGALLTQGIILGILRTRSIKRFSAFSRCRP